MFTVTHQTRQLNIGDGNNTFKLRDTTRQDATHGPLCLMSEQN